MTNETKFRPVVGLEEKILATDNHPGWVYFASDSGKIFLDVDTELRVSMGGSGSVIFYASDLNVVDTGYNGVYQLHLSALDDKNASLKENDIIINVDNCFYKIIEVDKESDLISTSRIAVAGGTGGGSGQPGFETGVGYVAYLNNADKDVTTIWGDECKIGFIVTAKDASGEDTSGGTVSWKLNGKVIATSSVKVGVNYFDVGPFLSSTITGEQTLTGTFSLDVGTDINSISNKTWKITAVDVKLNWEYDRTIVNTNKSFNLEWSVIGGNTVEKTTHIIINDGLAEITHPAKATGLQRLSIDRETYGLIHGKYQFELYVEFEVNGKVFKTDSVVKEIMFADSDASTPIIILGDYNKKVSQYDTLMIPIYFYNTNSATLAENGEIVEIWDDLDKESPTAELRYWSYTSSTAGTQVLTITCGSVEYQVIIEVEELQLDVKESDDYAFKIKSSDFSSNNALQKWSYVTPEKETVDLVFSDNFDWVNGGLKQEYDDNGNLRQYIRVKAGTTMTINYPLFKTFNRTLGKNIKVIFKVDNCGKYDASAIRSSAVVNTGTGEKLGIEFKAQNVEFKSGNNEIITQYCEDTYVEYELDIAPRGKQQYIIPWISGVPAGIKVYSDGDTFDQLPSNLSKIEIGSEDCDVNLYLFKVYERHLTDEEHLENFIMDALNANEIVSRYTRNDVLSDLGNGEIDWRKVVQKNPDCMVHLYKIPRMTKNKKDEIGKNYKTDPTVEVAKYYAMYKDGNIDTPVIEAGTDVGCPFSYKVQGTSSEKYVVSAANLDTKFSGGFLMPDGSIEKKFKLDENSPGENYYNTKVNVASCEGANNAINAAWYNDHQPYVSAAKKKNSLKRDTMNFKPGIIFMIDENPKYEITDKNSEVNIDLNIFKGNVAYENATEKFYKQYAICNFGNSKKNVETLHDAENPHEICIEVTDNQNIGQHMCAVMGRIVTKELNEKQEEVTVYTPIDITNQEISYDFDTEKGNECYNLFVNTMTDNDYDVRYTNGTDGIDNASPSQIIGWFNFVKWMALNDPSPYNKDSHPYGYTGAAFTENTPNAILNENGEYEVEFTPYVFKVKDWKGDNTVLGGFTVGDYAGKYTHDTHEYRMAKFLSECEDHLIMDSILYHYLFIERHLMVDNVAKNTFWSSEDENNQYWNLIKDYDNDTADGIDNSGKLSFTYGIEPTDIQSSGISFFNASDSVWFNFVHGLERARKYLYQQLNYTKVWSSQEYLDKFTKWQSCIPERCWIEDYYRKYVRPFEIFDDNGYLAMLEGGQKTLQRKQFETYQELYMNTKYETATSSYIDIRANAKDIANATIPVTMYSDCYIFQSWSQNIIKQRAKRGETYNITCPPGISNLTDATVYWYAPNTYSTIGDLGLLYPKSVKLGEAKRLQSLIIGENAADGLLSYTSDEIGINQAKLLKHLTLKNLTRLNKPTDDSEARGIELNLSELSFLQDLDCSNSLFTGLILPKGAPLTSVKVDSPKTIVMGDLNFLEEFEVKNYNDLQILRIDNIDNNIINSLDDFILKSNNLSRYSLKNIKWTIADSSLIDDEKQEISFLEFLSKDKFTTDYEGNTIPMADAIVGSLTIKESAYSGEHALEIYDKYAEIFPNLDIIFESDNCKLLEVNILDGNEQVIWKKKFKNSTSITKEFLMSGAGEDNNFLNLVNKVINSKQSTMKYIYTFDNSWTVTGENDIETISVNPAEGDESSYCPITESVFTTDIFIRPVFAENYRTYNITFANDESLVNYITLPVIGGEKIIPPTIAQFVPWKDDSKLPLEKTYTFDYWSVIPNGVAVKVEEYTAIKDYTFYANFKEISVYDNVLESKYFESIEYETELQRENSNNNSRINCHYPSSFATGSIEDPLYPELIRKGVYLCLSSNVSLRGKITLPLEITYKNVKYTVLGYKSGNQQPDVTHIFWEKETENKPCNVVHLQTSAFSYWNNLKYFEVPRTLRQIGSLAFAYDTKLEPLNFGNAKIMYIGDTAFGYCSFEYDKIVIPGTLGRNMSKKTLGKQSYALTSSSYNDSSIAAKEIQFGTFENPVQYNFEDINDLVFGNRQGHDNSKIKKITVYYSASSPTDLIQMNDSLIEQKNRILPPGGVSCEYSFVAV